MKVRWDWDSFSGDKWRVVSNESIGTVGSYNLVFSSCSKNGGRGCGGASEVKEITEVEGAKLFVHNVWEASPDQLEEAFSQHGTVTDTYNTGRGFVFVTFSFPAEAQAALTAMDGSKLFGNKIAVKIAHQRPTMPKRRTSHCNDKITF